MNTLQIIQTSLAITGIINCLIAAAFLIISKRGNIRANRFLSFMLQAIAVKIIYALLPLFHAPWNWSTVLVYYFCHSAYIAFGPLLYFYLRSYLQRELKPFHLASALTPVIFPFVPF
jgi:hypothetical protein